MDIPTSVVTTLASRSGFGGREDGTGTNALVWLPANMATDSSGTNLCVSSVRGAQRLVVFANPYPLSSRYIADARNYVIRAIDLSTKVMTTVAGPLVYNPTTGFADGARSSATFNTPFGLCINPQDTSLYIGDVKCVARAGEGCTTHRAYSEKSHPVCLNASAWDVGCQPRPPTPRRRAGQPRPHPLSRSPHPTPLCSSNTIRAIEIARPPATTPTPSPFPIRVTTLAGSYGPSGAINAVGVAATFTRPCGCSVDTTGRVVYVADT